MSHPLIYKALSEEPRLRIINILERGYFNVQELTSVLGLSQPTVSHHLKALSAAGLLKLRKEGTWSYYTLSSEKDNPLARQIVEGFLRSLAHANGNAQTFIQDGQACDTILTSRRSDMHQFFEEVASSWRTLRNEAQGHDYFLGELAALTTPEATVLELGCGTGALLEQLLPRSGRTIGVDYSQRMLNEAKNALGTLGEGVELRLGTLEHLPAADSSVDTVLCHMVLHHVEQPLDALREVARVLKKGGLVAIVDLAKHSNELMRQRYGDRWLGFDHEQFSLWMREAGISEVTVKPLGYSGEAFLATGRISAISVGAD